MSKQQEAEKGIRKLKNRVSDKAGRLKEHFEDHAEDYADDASDAAAGLLARGRKAAQHLSEHRGDYTRQLAHYLEDAADELAYRYRRIKRHAKRRPVATALVVAGTVSAFLLLRRAFNRDDD